MSSIHLSVSTMSGEAASVTLPCGSTVGDLKRQAAEKLGGAYKLSFEGRLLLEHHLVDATFEGANVTAVRFQPQVAATKKAFAYLQGDGSVITWGCPEKGHREGLRRLTDVRALAANRGAFAAICDDSTVVSWGSNKHGGDSSHLKDQLRDIQCIQTSARAFAALTSRGRVLSWGMQSEFQEVLIPPEQGSHEITEIQSNEHSFAAITKDGSVITWGHQDFGGVLPPYIHLQNVEAIAPAGCGFCALMKDHTAVAWGKQHWWVGSPYYSKPVGHVATLFGAEKTKTGAEQLIALVEGGCLAMWKESQLFITSPDEEEEAEEDPPSSFKPLPPKNLSRLRRVQANQHGWCAIKADGSIVTWGWPAHESLNEIWKPIPRKYFKGPFTEISANLDAFAGIQEDGNLVIWGRNDVYENGVLVPDLGSKKVQVLQASCSAFAAIMTDGTVMAFGPKAAGGDCSAVKDQLHSVVALQATDKAFAALRSDGQVISWGGAEHGGDGPYNELTTRADAAKSGYR